MSTPLAVLLIIGSVVVGPIEAQRVDFIAAKRDELLAAHKGALQVYTRDGRTMSLQAYAEEYSGRLESLPELCERAMREIGIDTKMKSGFVSYAERLFIEPDGTQRFLYSVGAYTPAKVGDDWPVRCIPVPAGYRK